MDATPTESMIWDMYRDSPDTVGVLSLRILRGFVARFTPADMARFDQRRLLQSLDTRIAQLNQKNG